MIRPVTLVCALIAAGSGLYLYHAKHRVKVMDIEIRHIVSQTRQAEARVAILRAEWEDLNRPDRLQALATRFLDLQPAQPNQFVPLSQLASRLPPPVAQPVPQPEPDQIGPDQAAPDQTAPLVASAAPPAANQVGAHAARADLALAAAQPGGQPVAQPATGAGMVAQPTLSGAGKPAARPAPVALVADAMPLRQSAPIGEPDRQRPADHPRQISAVSAPVHDQPRAPAAHSPATRRPDAQYRTLAATHHEVQGVTPIRAPSRPAYHAPRDSAREQVRDRPRREPTRLIGARIVRTAVQSRPYVAPVMAPVMAPPGPQRSYVGSALAAMQLPPPVPVRSDGR